MTKRELFQLGATRITVSTVAPTPDAFMEFCDSKCVLAWSVHAVSLLILHTGPCLHHPSHF